jgi:lipoprotein-releasing system permease protein
VRFPFYIAVRYLFSKKSHHAINIISGISVCGVTVATIALICTLSVFNGFHDMVASFFTSFDPQLKITAVKGKNFKESELAIDKVKQIPEIVVCTPCLEDQALLRYRDRQQMVTIKGVDESFQRLTSFNETLYGNGCFELQADVLNYGILGLGVAANLGTNVRFDEPVQVYAPTKGEKVDMLHPEESFNQDELYSPGVLFQVHQQRYDSHYVIASLRFAKKLFDREDELSSLELKVADGVDVEMAKEKVQQAIGDKFVVKDRYEQQEDVFKIMKVEKLISYIFLTFILVIACFNIIGSLSMLILDKEKDTQTLRNLGASDRQIAQIFMLEGRMISTFGAVAGLIIGLILCYAQQTFGLLRLGDEGGNFVVDAYPVSVHFLDVLVVFVTVLVVGYASVWYPVRYMCKNLKQK